MAFMSEYKAAGKVEMTVLLYRITALKCMQAMDSPGSSNATSPYTWRLSIGQYRVLVAQKRARLNTPREVPPSSSLASSLSGGDY
jgi:hypothetical protein